MSKSTHTKNGLSKSDLSTSVSRASLGLMALEPRVLLDAAGVVTGVEGVADALGQSQADDAVSDLFQPMALEAPRDHDNSFEVEHLTTQMSLLQSLNTELALGLTATDLDALNGNLDTGQIDENTPILVRGRFIDHEASTLETAFDAPTLLSGYEGDDSNRAVGFVVDDLAISRDNTAVQIDSPAPADGFSDVSRDYYVEQSGPLIEAIEDMPYLEETERADLAPSPFAPEATPFTLEGDFDLDNLEITLPDTLDTSGTSVVFVDTSVENYQAILDTLDPSVEVVLIGPREDGVEAMARYLEGRTDIDAIHIISHGREGTLNFGTSRVNSASINGQYADELALIGQAMTLSGDILIYGCDFGRNAEALDALALATGADIAASTNDTGTAALGGDWILESKVGAVEAESIFAPDFNALLAPVSISAPNGSLSIVDNFGNNVAVGGAVTTAGAVATWANAGTVGGAAVDIRAVVVSIGTGDAVVFEDPSQTGLDDPSFIVFSEGVGSAAQVVIRWEIVLAGTNIAATGNIDFTIADIDGIGGNINTRETVAPSLDGLTSYGRETPSNIQFTTTGGTIRGSGTQDQNGEASSAATFSWSNVSSWEVTYELAGNAITGGARFTHDGDGDFNFNNLEEFFLLSIDADGDNSTTGGANYLGSFTENSGGTAIVDSDINIVQDAAIGTDIHQAQITLTNPQIGDEYFINGAAVSAGDTGTVGGFNYTVTDTGTELVVTLTGVGTDAQYEAALQLITFNNTSEIPNTANRSFDISVTNTTFGTTSNIAVSTIVVTAVNDAPVAQNDGEITDQNTGFSDSVLTDNGNGVDSDIEGDTLNVAQVNGANIISGAVITLPSGALLTMNADGTYDYDPNGAFDNLATGDTDTDSFTYQISDGNGGFDTATVSITINGLNDAPIAQPDGETTDEDTAFSDNVLVDNGSGLDADPDTGDTLTVTQVNGVPANVGVQITLASGALLTVNPDGSYDYDPNGQFESLNAGDTDTDTFTYQVSDGNGGTDTETVTITINGAADAPTLTNDADGSSGAPAADYEDTYVENGLGIALVDGDALVTDADDDIVELVVTLTNGQIGDTINFPSLLPGNITAAAVPSTTLGAAGTIVLTFTGDASTTNADWNTVLQGLNFLPSVTAAHNPDPSDRDFTLQVSDSQGNLSNLTNTTIHVTAENDPPTLDLDDDNSSGTNAGNYTGTFTEDGGPVAIHSNILVTDLDDSNLESAQIVLTNPQTDDQMLVDGIVVTAGVNGTVNGIAYTVTTNGAGELVIDLAGSATLSDYDAALELITFNNTSDTPDIMQRVITVSVNDGDNSSPVRTAFIDIQPVNDAPVLDTPLADQASTDGNTTFSLATAANFSDPDDTVFVYSLAPGAPTWITIDPATGVVTTTGIPADASQNTNIGGGTDGTYDITVIATDPGGLSAQDTFQLNVINLNPEAVDDVSTADEDTAQSGNVITDGITGDADSPPDGDTLNISAVSGGTVGVAQSLTYGDLTVNNDGSWTFTPNAAANALAAGETAQEVVTYTVNDGEGGTDTATLTINITGVNDAPTAQPDSETTDEDTGFSDDVLIDNGSSVDADPDTSDTLTITEVNGAAIVSGGTIALPSGALLTMNNDGTYDYDPNGQFEGLAVTETATDSFTYTIDDGNGGTDTETVTITITGVNDGPSAQDDTETVDEDTVLAGENVLADNGNGADSDPDASDVLNVTQVNGAAITSGGIITLPSGALLTMNDNGIYDYDPNGVFNGLAVGTTAADSFTYTIDDSNGGTDTAIVTITITGVNDTPIAEDDAVSGDEDTVTTGDVFADNGNGVDTDPDGDTFTVSEVNGVPANVSTPTAGDTGGTFTINPDGTYSFDPNGDFDDLAVGETRDTTITYTIDDGEGGIDTATVTLTVSGVNDAPVPVDPITGLPPVDPTDYIPAQTGDDSDPSTPLNLTPFFGDPDGSDTLTISVDPADLPPGLVFTPSTGIISGTPDADASQGGPLSDGVYTIPVTVDDGNGGTFTTDVVYTISNPVPIAEDDAVSGDEDTVSTGDVFADNGSGIDNDPDGDTFTVSEVDGVPANVGTPTVGDTGGQFTINPDGTYSFDPSGDFDDLAVGETRDTTITYTIDDGEGGTDTATVTVTVAGVNDAPVPVDPITGLPPVDPADYIPAQTVDDSDPATPLDLTPFFGDPDGSDILAISVDPADLPPGLVFDPSTGIISGTPDADASQGGPLGDGVYTIPVTVDDGNGGTFTTDVVYTISNPVPIAEDDAVNGDEDTVSTGDVFADNGNGIDIDPDGDTFTVSEVSGVPANISTPTAGDTGGTFTINPDGTYSFDPNGDFDDLAVGETRDTAITYTIDDGEGGTDTATVTVTVAGINDAPVPVDLVTGLPPADPTDYIPAQTGDDSDPTTPLDLTPFFGDPDGSDTLAISIDPANLPPSLVFDPVTGIISGTPDADASQGGPLNDGVYIIPVTVDDGNGGTFTTELTYTITNPAPVVDTAIGPQTADDSETISIPSAIIDPDGDPLDYTATGLPPGLSIDPATGEITGTLEPSASQGGPNSDGVYAITVTADDEQGGTVTDTFVLTVNNPAPIAVDNGPIDVTEDEALTIDVLGNDSDPDGDTLMITQVDGQPITVGGSVTLPSGSVVTLNPDGTLGYDPAENLNGPDSFTYTIVDTDGAAATANVDINIVPVNDVPQIDVSLPDQTNIDGETITPIDVSENFSDIDNDPLTFTATGLPPGLSIDPQTGVISGTLEPDASNTGPYMVTVTATDPSDDSVSTDFEWGVDNVPPEVTTPIGPQSGIDGQPLDIATAESFEDLDGDPLIFTAIGLPDGVTIDPGTGVISGTLPNDSSVSGPYTVSVTVTDDSGDEAIETFVLDVTNPAPTLANLTPMSVNIGRPFIMDVGDQANDPDDDPMVFTASGLPAGLTIDPVTGVISGAPTEISNDPFVVVITVTDGQGGTAEQTLEITVNEDPFIPDGDIPEILPLGADMVGRGKSVDSFIGNGVDAGEDFDLRKVFEDREKGESLSDILDEYNYRLRGGMAMSASIPGLGDGSAVVIEGVAHDNSIFVTMTETISENSGANVTRWSVDMGGRALPSWIDYADGGDSLVINRTIGDETVTLRISAVLDNGRRISGNFEIDLRTGEIELAGMMSAQGLTLSDRFVQLADAERVKDKALLDALA